MDPLILFAALLGLVLAALLLMRRWPGTAPRRRAAGPKRYILIDGSNVMHWKDETPQMVAVLAVVHELQMRGFTPGVVFDANAGYKLTGCYMNERDFSRLLTVPEDQVFVVPKGSPADPFLLSAARKYGARVVTRDRYRDWAEAHPEVKEPGFLIRGGYRDSGALWLDEALELSEAGVRV